MRDKVSHLVSLGNPWGARGRKFESCRPDQYLHAVPRWLVALFVPMVNVETAQEIGREMDEREAAERRRRACFRRCWRRSASGYTEHQAARTPGRLVSVALGASA